jgi:hypothetical protein
MIQLSNFFKPLSNSLKPVVRVRVRVRVRVFAFSVRACLFVSLGLSLDYAGRTRRAPPRT